MFTLRNVVAYIFGSSIFFILGPLAIFVLAYFCPYDFMTNNIATPIFGAICSGVGLFFVIWSNYELITKGKGGAIVVGKVHLSKQTVHLVTTGPYSMCRNPMHMGLVLFYLGLCCAINSVLTLIVPLGMLIFAYGFTMLLDEPRLKKDFPEEFEKWVQDVPNRFWPKPKKAN